MKKVSQLQIVRLIRAGKSFSVKTKRERQEALKAALYQEKRIVTKFNKLTKSFDIIPLNP